MKKKILIPMIILLTFSLTFIGCENGTTSKPNGTNSNPTDNSKTDPALLNGTWVGKDSEEFYFTNGNFIFSYNLPEEITPFSMLKGTYTTSGNKITLTLTNVNYDNKWYSKDEFGAFLKEEDPSVSDELIADLLNEFFFTVTYSYSINGNKLTLDFTVYTKKQ